MSSTASSSIRTWGKWGCYLILLGACVGCPSKPTPSKGAKPKASTSASVAASGSASSSAPKDAPPRPLPLPKPQDLKFAAEDGTPLAGKLWKQPGARLLVVLVHTGYRTQADWVPAAKLIAASTPPRSVMTFDLRGHGKSLALLREQLKASKKPKKGKKATKAKDYRGYSLEERKAMLGDVLAAVAEGHKAQGGTPPVVLVGSSLGSTLAAMATGKVPTPVWGLGLICPGATLGGLKLYPAATALKHQSFFLAAGRGDTIAKGPLKLLSDFGKKRVTLRVWGTSAHGAAQLGKERPELWQELNKWTRQVALHPPQVAFIDDQVLPTKPAGSGSAAAKSPKKKPPAPKKPKPPRKH